MNYQRRKKRDKFALKLIKGACIVTVLIIIAVIIKYFHQNSKSAKDFSFPYRYVEYKTGDNPKEQVTHQAEVQSKKLSQKTASLFRKSSFKKIKGNITSLFRYKLMQSSTTSLREIHGMKDFGIRFRRTPDDPHRILEDHPLYKDPRLREYFLDALKQKEFMPFSEQLNLKKSNFLQSMLTEEPKSLIELEDMDNSEAFSKAEAYCKSRLSTENSTTANKTHDKAEEDAEHDDCLEEKNGRMPALWTILYILIVLCLFVGLAVICDEFFVPSLETISEKLSLSEDVAGATFMAAGSSAPELFTSVAGMGTGSDVGVGTIVGSAVFNLLVIIALTSSLCGRVIQLDWRPLVRDSIFYGFSIVVFILFSWDALFQWWESLGLLLLYVSYIVTMKFNSQLMAAMASPSCCSCFEVKPGRVSPDQTADIEMVTANHVQTTSATTESKNSSEVANISSPAKLATKYSGACDNATCENQCRCCCCCCCCSRHKNCRASGSGCASLKLETLPNNESSLPSELNSDMLCDDCASTGQMHVSFKDGPNAKDVKGENRCETTETSNPELPDEVDNLENSLPPRSSSPPPSYDEITCVNTTTRGSSVITCSRCHCKREKLHASAEPAKRTRIMRSKPLCCCCCFVGHNHNREFLFVGEVVEKIEIYEEVPTTNDEVKEEAPCTSSKNSTDNPVSGSKSSVSAPPSGEESAAGETSPDESENTGNGNDALLVFPCLPPIRHSLPEAPDSSHCGPSAKYIFEWVIYIISFPWLCVFTWTVPDCSKDETRKWFIFSFLMSILWIAGISYVMVELVEKIGCLLDIDNYTMGLVVIAIGTSVPDAISSVLVAKAGHGDMAVSNAIGSNVFDINLGLGLPFFLSSLITGKPVHLLSSLQQCLLEVLPLSIRMVPHVKFGLILLLILLLCLIVFVVVRFRLSKVVGYLFVIMYLVFMVYAFIQEKSCFGFFC